MPIPADILRLCVRIRQNRLQGDDNDRLFVNETSILTRRNGMDAVAYALSGNHRIKALDFYACLETGVANDPNILKYFLTEVLPNHPSIESLWMIGNRISSGPLLRTASWFANAIRGNTVLTHINLCDNEIDDMFAVCLAHALTHNKTVTFVDLRRNRISDFGARGLAVLISNNTNLEFLGLDSNDIGDAGCRHLADALRQNDRLKYLWLGGNTRITSVGATALEDAVRVGNHILTYLYIGLIPRVSYRIDNLCRENEALGSFKDQLSQTDFSNLPRSSWPTILERIQGKPSLLYSILQSRCDEILPRDILDRRRQPQQSLVRRKNPPRRCRQQQQGQEQVVPLDFAAEDKRRTNPVRSCRKRSRADA